MKKTIYLLPIAIFVGLLVAQDSTKVIEGTGSTGTTFITGTSSSVLTSFITPQAKLLPDSDHNVLLIRRASEPCNECGFRNAVYCSNMSADCGIPSKEVLHYHWYHTIAAALKDAEEQNWDVAWDRCNKVDGVRKE